MKPKVSPCISFEPLAVPSSTENLAKAPDEEHLLKEWSDDVDRAARTAAARIGVGTDHAMVDDLAQEARIQLLRILRSRSIRSVRYLRKSLANALRSAARPESRALGIPLEPDCDVPIPPEQEGRDLIAEANIRAWVAKLPPPLPTIYRLIYLEQATQRDAASKLGISQPRVAQLHRRLLELGKAELGHLAL